MELSMLGGELDEQTKADILDALGLTLLIPFEGEPVDYAPGAAGEVLIETDNDTITYATNNLEGQEVEITTQVIPDTLVETASLVEDFGNFTVLVTLAALANGTITTTMDELTDLLNTGFLGTAALSSGLGTDLAEAGTYTTTGATAVTLGTPARKGRIAINDGSVYTAVKNDLEGTGSGVWTKTYDAAL